MSLQRDPDSFEINDKVSIRLGTDDNIRSVEHYDFHCSILQQPQAFALKLSGAQGAADLLKKYPPGPQGVCQLFIGQHPQFTGELDAVNAQGTANETSVELRGRDLMARLHDSDITGERSFSNSTYEELFKAALADVALAGRGVKFDNRANRVIRSGANVKARTEPVKVDEVKQVAGGTNKFRTVVTAKMGESWLTFLERHFNKLGLFMWCDADGNFILSRPNGDQEATYHFFRKRGVGSSRSNVESFSFTNDTVHRLGQVVIFARNLGRKYGHNHTNGRFVDEEMVALGFGHYKRRVYRDVDVGSEEEARFYAQRAIAEANRASWKLQYVISGHSAPWMKDPKKHIVIVPDTVARIDDDELNIHDNMYIESVQYRSPPRTAVVTMMRLQDLVFGENQALQGKAKAKEAAKKAEQQRIRQPISFVRNPKDHFTNAWQAAVSTSERKRRG
jgi:prophage tail gpP-like protein